MLLGCHVSVAGGPHNGVTYARSVGAECLQFFAKSPRQWKAAPISPDALQKYESARAEAGFPSVFTHTAYLINLSSVDPELRARSTEALADELVRAAALGAEGVVTHIGNDPGRDPRAAAQRAAQAILDAHQLAGQSATQTTLLLENTAGSGTTFGGSVEELAWVLDACDLPPDRIGFCFDTCHAFAFGMPLDQPRGWRELLDQASDLIGLDRLRLIHANDCMFPCGSKRDRHAWIGDGHIGIEGFSAMICEPRLAHVRVVTEMPGESPEKDTVNLERLRFLRAACA